MPLVEPVMSAVFPVSMKSSVLLAGLENGAQDIRPSKPMTPEPTPRLHYVACLRAPGQLHRMAYWEWGDEHNPKVLVCVHGLARQGRDFDALARRLAGEYRVVCPDVLGRGRSEWLMDPAGYTIPHYVADMVSLLARLNAQTVDWVGTSMGGLIGLGMAALQGSPLRRLVLNDVGPTIEPAALQRIGSYLGQPAHWSTVEEAADDLWAISQGFGPHSREQWLALTRPQLRADGQGFKPHYDPAIAQPFKAVTPQIAAAGETALWAAWDSLRLPVLLLRGAQSDLLSPTTAQAMCERGPCARLHEFDGVGHAPMLVQPEQQQVVIDFLRAA
jgi:pimeloyl-ACP methyl ester carboxylesterase